MAHRERFEQVFHPGYDHDARDDTCGYQGSTGSTEESAWPTGELFRSWTRTGEVMNPIRPRLVVLTATLVARAEWRRNGLRATTPPARRSSQIRPSRA